MVSLSGRYAIADAVLAELVPLIEKRQDEKSSANDPGCTNEPDCPGCLSIERKYRDRYLEHAERLCGER
jgi:hypothetical protein